MNESCKLIIPMPFRRLSHWIQAATEYAHREVIHGPEGSYFIQPAKRIIECGPEIVLEMYEGYWLETITDDEERGGFHKDFAAHFKLVELNPQTTELTITYKTWAWPYIFSRISELSTPFPQLKEQFNALAARGLPDNGNKQTTSSTQEAENQKASTSDSPPKAASVETGEVQATITLTLGLHRRITRLLDAVCSGEILIIGEGVEWLYINMRASLFDLLHSTPSLSELEPDLKQEAYPESLLADKQDLDIWFEDVIEPALSHNLSRFLNLCRELRINPFDKAMESELETYDKEIAKYEEAQKKQIKEWLAHHAAYVNTSKKGEKDNTYETRMPSGSSSASSQAGTSNNAFAKAYAEERWNVIPQGRDRQMVRQVWHGTPVSEIAQELQIEAKTVRNRLGELRRIHGHENVPTKEEIINLKQKWDDLG